MIQGRLAPASRTERVRAPGRFAFSLSSRALLLLGIGLIWILPALIDRRALLIMAAWDVVVLTLAAADLRRLPRPSDLRVTRAWSSPLSIGSAATVHVTVENEGAIPIVLDVADYTAPALCRDLPEAKLRVGARSAASLSYDVLPRERGDLEIGAVAATWWSDWRLTERWGVAPAFQRTRVYPDFAAARHETMYLIRSRQVALEKRRAKFAGTGREFESLRDYREGDERRDVSWRASARRGKLVTRVYQPERSQAVWILVDAGRLLRARLADRAMLDTSATAALALAQVALASGDRVGLMAYGRRLQHRLAPARGAGHFRAIVEALATVHADGVDADHATAVATLLTAQKRRALIVWLTEIAETAGVPDVIEHAMTMAGRHVVLFAVMRQPELQDLAAAEPASVRDMYRVVAAQEALERRDGLLHGLRQRGALVVEVSPAELAAGVVDRYLETKERGLV